jgi:hypothetical protein
MRKILFSFFLISHLSSTPPSFEESSLMRDLFIADYWGKKVNERLPVMFNYQFYGGYFNMPSSRMGVPGEVGLGVSSLPPFTFYNLRAQLIDRFECSFNYRIFNGVADPCLTPCGFGDLSDRTVNMKIALFLGEDSDDTLPGLSFGFDDFLGTKNFTGEYLVLSKVHLERGLEWSLGYGFDRLNGFFGGVSWFPFFNTRFHSLKTLNISCEYDAICYEKEVHPKNRKRKSPLNIGLKYRLGDRLDASLSFMKGNTLAFSCSSSYNIGRTQGVLPKLKDPAPYRPPYNQERVGYLGDDTDLVFQLRSVMDQQGFDLLNVEKRSHFYGAPLLRLHVSSKKWRTEKEFRCRLYHMLAFLIGEEIEKVSVVKVADGFAIQEYDFPMTYVRSKKMCLMGSRELNVLVPMKNVSFPKGPKTVLFFKNRELYNFELYPKTRVLFGSATGKLKYALGATVGVNGFLPFKEIYYSSCIGVNLFNNMKDVCSVDKLNPSQLINVRTDAIGYYKIKGMTIDEFYAQKVWGLKGGLFIRVAGGYFEQMYGGIGAESLYYPANSPLALGMEGAFLKKRTRRGLGFETHIRKLEGYSPRFLPFTGTQAFLNAYYDWKELELEFRLQGGKFLANDWGARIEVSRYFCSGFRALVWFTITDGCDRVNGHQYYDKGIALSMPLDIFYTHSERDRWRYRMAAWLRDVGQTAYTGRSLYDQISEERY